jgi:hypothetical protein
MLYPLFHITITTTLLHQLSHRSHITPGFSRHAVCDELDGSVLRRLHDDVPGPNLLHAHQAIQRWSKLKEKRLISGNLDSIQILFNSDACSGHKIHLIPYTVPAYHPQYRILHSAPYIHTFQGHAHFGRWVQHG